MKLLGIDYGTKRVGIALSDASGSIAFPHSILSNDRDTLSRVLTLSGAEGVHAFVVGESKNHEGKDNPVMKDARTFAEELGRRSGLTVHFEPEFYTSVEARRLSESPHESLVDARAAAIILNSFIERSRNTPSA